MDESTFQATTLLLVPLIYTNKRTLGGFHAQLVTTGGLEWFCSFQDKTLSEQTREHPHISLNESINIETGWRFILSCSLRMKWYESNYIAIKRKQHWNSFMMTSSNGNIFRITGPLCGKFTGHWWIPFTKASDMELWCFLWSALE